MVSGIHGRREEAIVHKRPYLQTEFAFMLPSSSFLRVCVSYAGYRDLVLFMREREGRMGVYSYFAQLRYGGDLSWIIWRFDVDYKKLGKDGSLDG